MTARWPLALLFAVLCGGLCREALSQIPPQENPIRVPITTGERGFIIVPVVINHVVHARFLLDTGTNTCLITERFAAKIKANPLTSSTHAGWCNINGVRVRTVTVESIRFGGHALGNIVYRGHKIGNLTYLGQRMRDVIVGGYGLKGVECGVFKTSQVDLDQINLDVDGILGLNALSDTAMAIFPGRHVMKVYPTGKITPARRAAAGFGPAAARLPLSQDKDDGIYFCKVGFPAAGERTPRAWCLTPAAIQHTSRRVWRSPYAYSLPMRGHASHSAAGRSAMIRPFPQ